MSLLESIFLGLVQGLTEFLPVSSSGHLVIFKNLIGLREPDLLFDTLLHFGTLIAVFVYFRKDIFELIKSFTILCTPSGFTKLPELYRNDAPTRMLLLIMVGTIPTVFIGFVFKDLIENLFGSILSVGIALLITASILFSTRFLNKTTVTILQMSLIHAVIIGIAQGLAITPGISRSGATIGIALLIGIERETSGRFSFLLAIPAIIGATVLHIFEGIGDFSGLLVMIPGVIAATLTGIASLAFLLSLIRNGRFYLFSPYCLAVGLFAIFYWLFML